MKRETVVQMPGTAGTGVRVEELNISLPDASMTIEEQKQWIMKVLNKPGAFEQLYASSLTVTTLNAA